jgi:Tol biopolymer transport system component
MSRGCVTTARRATFIALLVVGLSSLLTVCWGTLTTGASRSLVLGPSARTLFTSATRSRAGTSGLVNLTFSPASERNPAWSPDGQRIAFTSDGVDTNGDGRIDAIGSSRQLYTMLPDGTGLQRYPLASGSVQALCWHPSGKAIYLVVLDGGAYYIRVMDLTTRTTSEIYASTNAISSVSIPPSGTTLYFDIGTTAGKGDIYSLPLPVGDAVPTQLTRSIYTSRHPVVASTGTEIIFESNRTGRWRIYTMALDGSNLIQLTTASVSGDDTEAMPTADGKIVFTTTRFINSSDLRNDSNVWIQDYAPEGSTKTDGTTVTPIIRFFPDTSDFSNQAQPSAYPSFARVNDLVFTSDKDGNDEIYMGALDDTDAPYVSEPPTVSPKTASPGAALTISVPVLDQGTGVRNVWLQIKDPDLANMDLAGQNHVIGWDAPVTDPNWYGDLSLPTEYGPFNPWTKTYLDISKPENHPGYYAIAGSKYDAVTNPNGLFKDEGGGYPEVPAHWMPMYDDGTHGDATAGDGTFTCQWTTPSNGSDWVLDVIVEDASFLVKDTLNRWHGNRRRFDNVGGCSTLPFSGNRRILLVDDYMDGQRFLSTGLPPVSSNYSAVCYLNTPYYYQTNVLYHPAEAPAEEPLYQNGRWSYKLDVSPFAPGSAFGGADLWRLLCRGPVPASILDRYLPRTVTQVSANDGRTPFDVRHADRLVVWSSPSAWYRLIGPLPGGSGSLLETAAQTSLTDYLTNGGRLLVIGPDLPTGLTMGGTRASTFMTNILGVKIAADSTSKVYQGIGQLFTGYANSLPDSRWDIEGLGLAGRNANPSQYVSYTASQMMRKLVWDSLTLNSSTDQNIAQAFRVTDATDQGNFLIGVSREFPMQNSRLVFWTFGYEHMDNRTRGAVTLDTMEWLMDGSVSGTVVRINDLQPISDALVTISTVSGTTTKILGAARTDGQGKYLLQGIRPGTGYTLEVTANGYYGVMTKEDVGVKGGVATTGDVTNFFLSRDTNTCILWGYVTQGTLPVANAEVKVAATGGSAEYTTTTDTAGHYEISNLAIGPYSVTATHPVTKETGRAAPNPYLTAGVKMRADINLNAAVVVAHVLAGTVTGNGVPLRQQPVIVKEAGVIRASLTTDQNGYFSVADLPSSTYTIEVSAAGYLSTSRTVVYDATTGVNLGIDLSPLSSDPTTVTISGRVYNSTTGGALGGATVDLLVNGVSVASMTSYDQFQQSAASYNFTFTTTASSYQLRIKKNGWRTQTKLITLSPGDVLSNLEFRMEPLLTLSAGTVLFGLPGDFATHTVNEVFGVGGTGQPAVSTLYNKLAYYDTANHTYVQHTALAPITMETGRAYWTHLNSALTITTEGETINDSAPFQLMLQKGWNLIANPFSFTVDLFDCGVILEGNVQKGWNDAVLTGNANSVAYTWDGRQYVPTTMLMPYRGYWVYVAGSGSGGVRMVVSNRSSARSVAGPRARRLPTSTAWQVRLDARAGECRDTANTFGVSPEVRDGAVNPLNLLEPPHPPAHYVSLAFLSGTDTPLAADMRAPGSADLHWRLRVETDLADTDVVVSWPELAAQLPAGAQVVLRDLTSGQVVYANTTGSYVFRSGATGAARDFEITVSPRTGSLAVGDIRASGAQGRSEAILTYTLSDDARVEITLRTATGRLVRTLAGGVAAHAGVNTLTWSRVDGTGRALPRGSYLCEVRATGAGGRLARGVGVITLLAVH